MYAVYAEIASDVHSVFSVLLKWRIAHEEHLLLIADNFVLLRI